MRHFILWMQGVGGGAGVHREGQHGGLQQVRQEHVQKYRWHIKTFVSIIARLMVLSTRSTLTRTTRWASTSTARMCSKVHIAHLKCCKHHGNVIGTIYQLDIDRNNIVSIVVGLLGLGGQVDIGGHQQNQHSGHQEVPRECV